ncbi:MAG: response regulator [Saccharofermentanales bacterium]
MREIIIVDDEPVIRAGLKTLINSTGSFRVTHECRNGKEGLEKISEFMPDIVIMDIKMPVMDGMELLEKLSNLDHKSKIIVLSGYGEFDYAQAAIRYGAIDYILKPVDHSILINKLNVLSEILDKEAIDNTDRDEQDAIALINGNISRIPGVLRTKGNTYYFTAVVDTDSYSNHSANEYHDKFRSNSSRGDICARIKEKFSENSIPRCIAFDYDDKVVVIIAVTCDYLCDIPTSTDIVKKLFYKIVNSASIGTPYTFYAGISTPGRDPSVLSDLYSEAVAISKLYISRYGKPLVFTPENRITNSKVSSPVSDEILQASNAILAMDIEELQKITERVLFKLKDPELSPEIIYEACMRFAVDSISSAGISECENYSELLKKIENSHSLPEVGYHFLDHATACINKLSDCSKEKYGHIISEVIVFMNRNIGDKDLSSGIVSSRLHLDPSYFCRLFKEKTGFTFSEFLVARRVDRARILLRNSSVKISDISDMVGFQNVKYFYKVFKQMTDCTPKEFREM